jgi:acyl-coenzyme A thioesterase PaaI-like protein
VKPSDDRAREDADNCFVCGPDNPIGLRIPFVFEGDVCRATFVPNENHAGFDGVAHGGIIFSVLDDVMANWLFLQKARGVTAKCEIRYRSPLPIGREITVECRLKRRKGRLVQLESKAVRDDATVVAEAEASFMVDDFGDLGDPL